MSSILPTVSTAQLNANRANAKKSTGPGCAEGKSRSSRNATKHGIFAREVLVDDEDAELFRIHQIGILRRLNPRDDMELQLVEQVVADAWRIKRARAAERELYAKQKLQDYDSEIRKRKVEINRLEMNINGMHTIMARALKHRPEREVELKQEQAALDEAKQELEQFKKTYRSSASEMLSRMIVDKNSPQQRMDNYERRLNHSMHRSLKQLREMQKGRNSDDQEITELAESIIKGLEAEAETAPAQNEPNSDVTPGESETCEINDEEKTEMERKNPTLEVPESPPLPSEAVGSL